MAAVTRRPTNLNPAYRFIAAIVRPVMMALTKRDWRGQEHIPVSGGCIVVTNHISYADVFALAHFVFDSGREPYLLGKSSVFEIPFAGAVLRRSGQIPVYRESGQAADAFREAVAAVEGGKCVVIYPEGTLTRDPELWPMTGKTGAARIALLTKCPVIPVAQWGPQEIIAPYGRRLHLVPRKTMHLLASSPLDLTDLHDQPMTRELLRTATARIMDAITANLEILRGESAPPVRFDSRHSGLPRTGRFERPDDS